MMGHQTVGGYLAGPSNFIIDPASVGDDTGTVEIKGSLQVNGTTTTVNSATLDVADLNITVAKGSANAGAADGAGLTVDGANATLTYDSANDRWSINKSLAGNVVGNVTGNVTGNVNGNVTGTVSDISNFSTTDLAEGTNLYYTDQRADTRATLRITAADIGNLNNVDETGVAIRAGHHCCQILHDKLNIPASARASVGIYNTKEDLEKLNNSIDKCKKIFNLR